MHLPDMAVGDHRQRPARQRLQQRARARQQARPDMDRIGPVGEGDGDGLAHAASAPHSLNSSTIRSTEAVCGPSSLSSVWSAWA